jgi:hypothetical protein
MCGLDSSDPGLCEVVGYRERDKCLGSIKNVEFLDQLND